MGGKRKIQGKSFPFAFANFREISRPRVQRKLVCRDIKGIRAVIEGLLRSITMMHIEIDDQNFGEPVFFQGIGGPDGCITEEAKTHASVGFRMMTGWSNESEAIVNLPSLQRID